MNWVASADGRNPRKPGCGVLGLPILRRSPTRGEALVRGPGSGSSRPTPEAEDRLCADPMSSVGLRSGDFAESTLATHGEGSGLRHPRDNMADDGIQIIKRAASADGEAPRELGGVGWVFAHSLTTPMADTPQISVPSLKFGGGGEPPPRSGTINARLCRGPRSGARPGGIPWMPHPKFPAGRDPAAPRHSSSPGNVTRHFRVDRQGPGMNSPVASISGPRAPFSARGRPESPYSQAPAGRAAAAAPGRNPDTGFRTTTAQKDSVRRTRAPLAHDGETPGFQRSDGSIRSMGRGSKRSGFPTTTTINPIEEDATHAVFS